MPNLPLEDLRQRIARHHSELQALRRELDARENQLGSLTQRKQELEIQLHRVEAEMAALAAGKQRSPSIPPKPALRTLPTKPLAAGKPGQPSLPALIVTMLREASRPLTVKQLAEEAKRRGFRSASGNFPKLVETRAYALKKKGILRGAANQPGLVLAPSMNSQGHKLKPAQPSIREGSQKSPPKPANWARHSGAAQGKGQGKAAAVKQPPLHQVLTEILKKSSKPMTGSQLATQALRAGYRSTSRRFVDVVWVILSDMDNVEHVSGRGYRLRRA